MSLDEKNVSIIGLGMMGGAIADALRAQNPKRISAYDTDQEVLEEALVRGTIDYGAENEEELCEILSDSDLVYVCLYPEAALEFMKKYMSEFKRGSIVTDVVGIKLPTEREIVPILRDDISYIPGHPMAGSEKEGFGAADASIFENRNYVLVPVEGTDPLAIDKLKEIITQMGFSNIVETTAAEHDSKIAFTSQLCHVIASALVDSEDDLTITDYEGGSFGELTRIAMINAPMWTEIFIDNKDLLVEQIDEFEDSLKKIRHYITTSDHEQLESILGDVRRKRVAMEVDRRNKHRKD